MKVQLILFALLTVCLAACSTQRDRVSNGEPVNKSKAANEQVVRAAETGLDLTSYLRRIPGLQITGRGENAEIRIRNSVSFETDYRPLLVVNGTPVGTNYSSLFNLIDPNEIDKVKVLKNVSETSRYGVQGGNGVLEITLRK